MNRGRMIAIGAVAALVILIAVGFATRGFGLLGGDRDRPLVLHGNVDIRQVDLGFRVSGRIATMPFEEGVHVPAGAVLAGLDAAPLKDSLAAAEAQFAAAGAELDKRRAGNRPQEIAQAQAELAGAESALAKARADFDRRVGLAKTGAVSEALLIQTRQQYQAAQADVARARQALSLQRAGFRREDIEAAAAQRAQAIAERDKARTDLADATLHAPHAGVILTRAREPGAIVQSGETVLTLTIDRPMRIRAYIDEPDLGRISPDMRVEVTADGNPRTYHGTIGYIAPTAEFTPKTVQTEDLRSNLVYRIRVLITDPDDALRQGAPVTVTIPNARPKAK